MTTVLVMLVRARRLGLRAGAVALASAVALLALALPASAHITVSSDDAHQGASDAVLSFRVPNEEDTATTVKVAITFPKKTPLASVKPALVPGWTATTTPVTFNPPIKTDDGTITTGVGQVTYTASSAATSIPVGGFADFQVLVGPLPDKAADLAFPTLQTYSNGKVVSWVQPVTDPNNPPDNPAPVLQLVPAAASGAAMASSSASPSVMASPAATDSAMAKSMATTSQVSGVRTLAVTALVLAVLGILAAVGSLVRGRRTPDR